MGKCLSVLNIWEAISLITHGKQQVIANSPIRVGNFMKWTFGNLYKRKLQKFSKNFAPASLHIDMF